MVRDGEWLHADGTTLGADNGIGVAAMLALMEKEDEKANQLFDEYMETVGKLRKTHRMSGKSAPNIQEKKIYAMKRAAGTVGAARGEAWLARADEAMDSMVRKSLEMRVVVLLLPNVWPFNRGSNS